MVKFGFEGYQEEFYNWSKHHKTVGIRVKRVRQDGTVELPEDQTLKELVINNEELLQPKSVTLYNTKTNERTEATDYYLPLQNLEYKPTNLEYYSVGAMNTSQTTNIRLTFLLEYSTFILDYQFKSSGSYARSFYDLLGSMDAIEDIIQNVIEEGKPFQDVGIKETENGDYYLILVSEIGETIGADIEKRELLKSLIGVEIYQFEQEIVNS